MPVVKMPDGANVSFPDNMPPDQIRSMIAQKFPDTQSAPKQSMLERAAEPITSYPKVYNEMRKGAEDQMSRGVGQIKSGLFEKSHEEGLGDYLSGIGNTAMGAASYLTSPINAALRTVVGKPLEDATGIPKEISEPVASLMVPIPGVGIAGRTRAITPGSEAIQAAGELSLKQFPKIAATDSIPAKRIGMTAAKVPWSGTPIQTAIEESSKEVGRRSAQIAGEFAGGGQAATRAEAGGAVRSGIEKYIKEVAPARSEQLYEKVGKLVDKTIKTPLSNTEKVAETIRAERGEAFLGGDGGAVDRVAKAILDKDGLTYQGIKKLRTDIGEDISKGILPVGMSQGELKAVYGALSEDLKVSVNSSGGTVAKGAFERANKYHRLSMERREQLAKTIGTKSDETIYDSVVRFASAKGGANIAMLSKVRKAVPPDEWNEIASVASSRLGQTIKGNVDTFNPSTFLKEYGNLTPAGKSLLFDSTGKSSLRRSLDNIEKVSVQLADLGQYANPSGTAQQAIGTAFGIAGFTESLMSGGIPLATVAGLVGIRGLSQILSRPVTANAVSRWSGNILTAAKNPSQANVAKLNVASTNLAASLRESGFNVSPAEIMRALQGSSPTSAGEKQD